jgi:type 1 glutamine amidotransferase
MLLASCLRSQVQAEDHQIKALIVEGQNNHKAWPNTTKMMKQYLEETGLFKVDVVTTAPQGTDENFHPTFSDYQVVISNYNGAAWPKATQESFVDYMKNGGGFVVVHAADNAFNDWKEYNEMIGLGGWNGRSEKSGPYVFLDEAGKVQEDKSAGPGGHHGSQHEFEIIVRDPEHPITKGLTGSWLHSKDELYDLLRGPATNMHILATAYADKKQNGSGRHEPMLMTIEFGKGRIFHTTLGHAEYSMECVGFITTLQRGAEWAATGKVTQKVPADFPTADAVSERKFVAKPQVAATQEKTTIEKTTNEKATEKKAADADDADVRWVVYEGGKGPGAGKQIVLIAGDEEYRSEEGLPQLGKILSQRHGFKCTVLFSQDEGGIINPENQKNIPGIEALKSADMLVMLLRFRNLPNDQMKIIDDYVNSGKPILGLRTSTHAFNIGDKDSPYAKYSFNSGKDWIGGFGQQVLGDTWISHHGHHKVESTRGVVNPEFKSHPILRGVTDVWGPSDVYGVTHLPADAQVLLYGQVLEGMNPTDKPVAGKKNEPMMPLFWTKSFKGNQGKESRIICTTMGASTDLLSEGLRRAVVNSVYWGLGMEDQIPAESNVEIVGDYEPTAYGFGSFKKGVKVSEHLLKN